MTKSAGRKGRRWRANKVWLHSKSEVCWRCGHAGAFEADHVPERRVLIALGLDPDDRRYLRPAHGSSCPCPTCGEPCNQKRSTKPKQRMTRKW